MALWFRFYSEALDDPKVQSLPADMFKAWVNLLCIASKTSGALPSIDQLAFHLRCDIETANAFHEELSKRGLIDVGARGSRIHSWDKRQYKSDTSTERVKRFRKRSENVSVTPPEPDTEPEPEKKTPTVPKGTRAVKDKSEDEGWFDEAIRYDYPKKSARLPALRAWMRLSKADKMACAHGVVDFSMRFDEKMKTAKRPREEELRFVPDLSTFINQRRWELEKEISNETANR